MEFLSNDRIQILIIFFLGFLMSQLFVATGLAEWVVLYFLQKAKNNLPKTSLFLIFISSLLSSFIPNMITVLTLLPALKMLIFHLTPKGTGNSDKIQKIIATHLTCSLIWGANIGGNSSVTGSPANLLLLFFLEAFEIPGREGISFTSWLFWGIPLVIVFNLLGWALGLAVFYQKDSIVNRKEVRLPFPNPRLHAAALLSTGVFIFIGFISVMSFSFRSVPSIKVALNLGTLLSTGLIIGILFFPNPLMRFLKITGSIMKPSDCWLNLPIRGLSFTIIVVICLAGLARLGQSLGVSLFFQEIMQSNISTTTSPLMILFIFSTITIYATEFLSNSFVATILFLIANPLTEALEIPALPIFLGISMASTCAFMTPIATPVNSLALSEVRNISFLRMMGAGFVLNLIGAFLVTLTSGVLAPAILNIIK